MAEDKAGAVTYQFVIKVENSGESTQETQETGTAYTPNNPEQQADKPTAKELLKMASPFIFAAKTAGYFVRTGINMVELRTGNSTLQNRLNTIYSGALSTGGFLLTLGIGIGTANPALIGAAVLSAASGIGNIVQKSYQLDLQKSVQKTSISLANERAGGGRRLS